jgi:hypothetical protein
MEKMRSASPEDLGVNGKIILKYLREMGFGRCGLD